jgi:NTE family protein
VTARIGLVLGAGGIAGQAFHAGALAAIEDSTGWDPRTAEVIVGTSAGSSVGAFLRAGVAARDLFAYATRRPLSAEGRHLLGPMMTDRSSVGLAGGFTMLRMPHLPAVRDLAGALRHPWRAPLRIAASLAPRGRVPTEAFAASLRGVVGSEWPDPELWLPVVRLRDGARVVFGRDALPADLATAVAASCAIPGYFAPVVIDGETYVDGGVHSPTNLDLLADRGLDAVVVLSPMSIGPGVHRRAIDVPIRRYLRAMLAGEARRVRRGGTEVMCFQPTSEDLETIGLNPMEPSKAPRIAAQVYDSTGMRLDRSKRRELGALAA